MQHPAPQSASSTTLSPALQAAFLAGELNDQDFLPIAWPELFKGVAWLTEPTQEFMQGVFVSEMVS
ncbi:hypothetical protein KAK11_03700 [Ideonella paludis]|uniref:Uncharacterized protein n=1 Tax=Ideonella paludis TaxID=1233411 RepID=A0ABS5DTF8_9BURK|nr:hypothetical protein [Ideonella paludis]